MIYVGLDDTDILDSPGTNQLARQIVQNLRPRYHTELLARFQLFFDPRVPYTSHNGSAGLRLKFAESGPVPLASLIEELAEQIVAFAPPGSDPGLCVASGDCSAIIPFAHRCQSEVVERREALELAEQHGIFLQGLGGTHYGVIGALAAVGLLAEAKQGRILHWGDSQADFSEIGGLHTRQQLLACGVSEFRCPETEESVLPMLVDVGKRLRPNLHEGSPVLYVQPGVSNEIWQAVKRQ